MKCKTTEYQFSSNGINWHDYFNAADRFFRERIIGVTDWSEPFELTRFFEGSEIVFGRDYFL